ncbi:uroporphyrinogen-III synthase [Sulfurimonas sp.]|jgi:uroporphyrinogen-III synthase|uniref:uroporphyrinogen-III synthase n=1 Tax=Sulfurimonas sp. TaxID=2022749 RepID=UPI0025EE0802|nr:uroporphyrinogen-III synthase [Sulfurimonas sp.]MBT5933959.1 uroporphyrinogen-III synthase [Sulfurimonas sp.]
MSKQIYLFSTSFHPDVISVNSLDITLLKPSINFCDYDYLIITSKQAVRALQQYDTTTFIDKRALCISEVTAASFEEIDGTVLEVGSGYGDDLHKSVSQYPKKTKWLYLRAKKVASNFVETLTHEGYCIDEEIVYESKCSDEMKNIEIEDNAVLVFTSPSSINCFLQNNQISLTNNVVVIGTTTGKSLPPGLTFNIAKENTIESCITLAKSL